MRELLTDGRPLLQELIWKQQEICKVHYSAQLF